MILLMEHSLTGRHSRLEELNQASNSSETTPLTKGNVEKNSKSEADGDTSVNGAASDMDVDSDRNVDASSDVASDFGGSSRATSTIGTSTRNGRGDNSNPTPKSIAHAKERARAREKAAEAKAAQASSRRKDDDVAKLDRRLEAIEREFRQTLGMGRSRPIGKDRFHNRIWWFDGLGAASLLGHSGNVVYGTGRVFVQGPNESDMEMMWGREDYAEVTSRRQAEEGEGMMLQPGQWGCYSDPEQVREPSFGLRKFCSLSPLAGGVRIVAQHQRTEGAPTR